MRQSLRTQCHILWSRARQRKSLRVFALGQRLRHFTDHVAHKAGRANGERVRRWFQDKKTGWYTGLADPQLPATRTLLDQAHNASERKLFARKGFHHPGGSHQAFLTRARSCITCPVSAPGSAGRSRRVEVKAGEYPPQPDAQPANPHLGRLAMSEDTLHPRNSWNVQRLQAHSASRAGRSPGADG